MANWLKAAEGLFEVVDRRAKLVVGEQSDEQSSIQPPASNKQGSRKKRSKSKVKPQKQLSLNESPTTADTASEQTSDATIETETLSHKDRDVLSGENNGISLGHSSLQSTNEEQHTVNSDSSVSAAPSPDNGLRNDDVQGEVSTAVTNVDSVPTLLNGDLINETSSVPPVENSSAPLAGEGVEVVQEVQSVDSSQNVLSQDSRTTITMDEERSQSTNGDESSNADSGLKDTGNLVESQPDEKVQHRLQPDTDARQESHTDKKKISEPKTVASPTKVQDQLDEAQGLLKSAVSTGQSKEARLARVCAGLSSRLQEYKAENAQLEELLVAERELSKSYEAHIHELQKDLSTSKNEVTRIESNMVEALAAKNSEIEALVSSMDTLKKQAALAEGNLASLQANMESVMRNRELSETRMMQALREELSSAERRAEEERAAHNATKMAAMEREVELEHRALDASTALARIQRTADERTAKAVELEQKVALLEVECSSLNQELQDMTARVRREQKKSPDEANQVIQAWQEEVERARQGQRDAESKLSSLEAELQKMRVEMAAMKRDAEHYSRQEHMELEKRYRELTDLLYYKQTQLESMTSEKAAAEFQLEKEKKRIQEAQVEVERSRSSRRASSSWEEDTDIKALEPLPLHHRHMVGASEQLQKAVKFLDSGAVRATRFLWRYPTARLLLLFYLVFVHLFLMYLLHRLQEQADTFASREVAESMGLANHTLP